MKRILLWLIAIIVVINILVAGAFMSAGGLQMLKSPNLPEVQLPLSLSSDLGYFHAAVLANEVGTTQEQVASFSALVDAAGTPDDVDELSLIASQSLAAFDNAHTTVLKPLMYRLPVRFHWTSDALIVVKARPKYAALLGRRILSLGGKSPEEMLDKVPELVGGGTNSWVRYRSEYFYSTPSALSMFGADVQGRSVKLQTLSMDGVEETIELTAGPKPMPGDPFWDFLDSFPGDTHFDTKGWVTLLQPGQKLPLYLQETERVLLLRELPEYEAVYMRANGSFHDDNETVGQFSQRVVDYIDSSSARNIIVDFRFNRGGDYTLVLPLVKDLSKALPLGGRLYLITGPNTFSAGLVAGSQFKRYVPKQLTVVGSEVGDNLRFRAEGFTATLPYSQIGLYLTTAWGDVAKDCTWFADCFVFNKLLVRGVGSLDTDIAVANTWKSYREAEDRVLEAVLLNIRQRTAG